MSVEVDWEILAYDKGFNFDERVMLETMLQNNTIRKIAAELGISTKAVSDRMGILGIRKPTRKETDKLVNRKVKIGPRLKPYKARR